MLRVVQDFLQSLLSDNAVDSSLKASTALRMRRTPPARVRPPRDGPARYTGALRRVSASLGLHSVHFDKSSGALTRVAVPEDGRTRMEMPNA